MQTAPIRVMLVEDDPTDAEFAKRTLWKAGQAQFELCWASRLSESLQRLQDGAFDVMLLDLGLPDCDELQALDEVRRANHLIPIIILTGLNDESTSLASMEHGAQDYLVKGSFTADTLSRSIRYAIQRQQLLSATHDAKLTAESRANLAAIVDCSDDAIISQTLDGTVLSWNKAAERMYGYSAEEVLGGTTEFLFPQDRADETRRLLAAVQRGEELRHFETVRMHKDGHRVSISLSVSPIEDGDGKIFGISKTARDFSERTKADQTLRESQERFELAVRGTSDGICDWGLTTGNAYWSPRVHEMLGFADGELPSTFDGIAARIHPEDRERTLRELSENTAERKPVRSEFRMLTKAGEYRWFQGRGEAVYDEAGTPYRFAGALTDITQRKQMDAELAQRDEQLRQSQKLEAVGLLAGGVAHEFNNLLQAIRGYTQFAMRDLPPDEQRFQDLEQVLQAAGRAATLTRQLLGFSRKEALRRVHVDPRQVVTDLVKMIKPLIGEHIEITTKVPREVGTLCADAGLLQQMLMNLCINARDAMPSGGRLTLSVKHVELSERYCALHTGVKRGPHVVFSLADTGCGMTPEVRNRIFEPFFTTKEVGRGTGLGLSMVYGIVQQHEGTINVYSEPGAGTTFKIYMPLVAGPVSIVEESAPLTARAGTETILLAEDEPMVRDLAVRILSGAGYSVMTAADGAQAVEIFESHADSISLALLDAAMPKMNGHQVCQRIRLVKPDLPVVFCSGFHSQSERLEFLQDKGVRLVQKPFDPDDLLRTLREVLDGVPVPHQLC
ncbi:MAG TPA: response regulator [Pirellulales bacterium]|nr:response regulator [Pirellulales bacterium]